MKRALLAPLVLCTGLLANAIEIAPKASDKIVPPSPEWKARIRSLAPAKPRVAPGKPRRVLVFSLATGYCHAVIPHVQSVMDTLAATGAFEVTHSVDIDDFQAGSLRRFDAVVLNNACSQGPGRNMFLDVLSTRKGLTERERDEQAAALEESLTAFVAAGKGLVAIHGGVTFLNSSETFGGMLGATFEMHPRRQDITLTPVDPEHPLVAAFEGEPFRHNDEPYLFAKPYAAKNFRPLLEMDVAALAADARKKMAGDRRYVSWIKAHGKGRVFYVSPSHQPESYESSRMLQFYLDGIQYALGDLKCDDSPVGNP